MGIEIKRYDAPDMEAVTALYSDAGWANYTDRPEMLRAAWENSFLRLAAFDGERLVGILRAVGDGSSILYIQDIIVHTSMKRRGIGSALVKKMLELYPKVYQTVLMTDNMPDTVAFYSALGFMAGSKMNCEGFMKINAQ